MAQLKLHIAPAWLDWLKRAHRLVPFSTGWKLLRLFVMAPHVYIWKTNRLCQLQSRTLCHHSQAFLPLPRRLKLHRRVKMNFFPQYDWGKKQNKYLELNNSLGCRPNLNYLLSSFASKDITTYQNNATTYRKHERTLRYGHTDTLCINFPFFEFSSFIVIPNNLASYACCTA